VNKAEDSHYLRELRLFLEEICCDLCRFHHVAQDQIPPERVSINQEVALGAPGTFADIRVQLPGAKPYFVEVKYGYAPEKIIRHISRKYGMNNPASRDASKLIVVIDSAAHRHWKEIEIELRSSVGPQLELEVWNEESLFDLIHKLFELKIDSLGGDRLIDIRTAIERVKGLYAFGEQYANEPSQLSLLWHFSYWSLRHVRETRRGSSTEILPPGLYKGVAVVFADLSGFSGYVRDTRDPEVVRDVLTSFYSKARYQVISSGGMLYQFVGDGLIALFGILESEADYVSDALECASALIDIGNSMSNEWQRQIDHIQNTGGCHIGIAIGDLSIMPLRPFSRSHIGAIADSINIAARLSGAACADEIVASNAFVQKLGDESQRRFTQMEPVEARNIGRLRSWKLSFT
jgi:class 3 adenylate cyclase